jgi:hypothetical protein
VVTDSNGFLVSASASTAGQFLISNSGAIPSFQNPRNVWLTTIPATASLNSSYAAISGTPITTLPLTATLGDTVSILLAGATSWQVNPGAGQTIVLGNLSSSVSITSSDQGDFIALTYIASNKWYATSVIGNIILS